MKGIPSLSEKTRVQLFVALVAVSGLAFIVVMKVLETTEERTSTYPVAITRVELDVGSGSVNLEPAAAGVEANVASTFTFGKPDVTEAVEGTTLKLRQRCGTLHIGDCSTTFSMKIPAATEIAVKTNSGDIDARELRAPARLESKSGDIDATRVFGPIETINASGATNASNLTSLQARLQSASGDISFSAASPPASLDVQSTSGDVSLRLAPQGEPYRLVAESSTGRVTTKVRTAPDAPRAVTVRSRTGDLDVETAAP